MVFKMGNKAAESLETAKEFVISITHLNKDMMIYAEKSDYGELYIVWDFAIKKKMKRIFIFSLIFCLQSFFVIKNF